ncbi:MAG: triose-phosphate isomerase [Bdellovibrio sp.]
MQRKHLICGNWKMNQSVAEVENFFQKLPKEISQYQGEAWVAPQFIHIPLAQKLTKETGGKVKIGAQNCAATDLGAFTGEVAASSLKDLGVDFVIIGHSERRAIFGETDQIINAKVKKALEHGLFVILCVGETLQERESNKTFEVVKTQTLAGLKDLKAQDYKNLAIAYEPVWAIGTGKVATPEQAQEVHAFIRGALRESTCPNAQELQLLYGGSVKPDNVEGLLKCADIDGALVGGASLMADSFYKLCQ